MGIVAKVALTALSISFMVFVAFFGRLPIFRHSPIAWLHRFIWVSAPNAVLALDQRLAAGRVTSSCARLGKYLMNERHPTVVVFFSLLLVVSEMLYLPSVWPQLRPIHKILGSLTIATPYVFLYLAVNSDPGYIGSANHTREMARYPYDFALFHPRASCRTCKLLKPARSKHCSICKRCISRLDHHCIFINNCVGSGNHHWFLLLLFSTGILGLYGAVLGTGIVTGRIRARYPHWSAWSTEGSLSVKQWLALWTWGLQENVAMAAVTLLALMTSPLVLCLLGYHAWLIYCGTTTNESLKWSDWQLEIDEGCVFKRRLREGRAKDLRVEPEWTRWPVEAEQVLCRTENGDPPAPDNEALPGNGPWERVWAMRNVDNLYDIGFWHNLVDVFRPYYSFRDYAGPLGEDRERRRANWQRRKHALRHA